MSLAFPNVPQLPGVPQLVRAAGASLTTISLGVAAISNVLGAASNAPNVWGLFAVGTTPSSSGGGGLLSALPGLSASANLIAASVGLQNPAGNSNALVQPDSIRDLDFQEEWRISKYPVQRGSFTSFNRVAVPYEISLRMVKGGSLSARTAFINQIVALRASTNLYTIITPELVYTDLTFTRWSQSRKEAAGAFFLIVDLFFEKVIQIDAQYSTTSSTPSTSNAADPSAVPSVSQGTVSPPITTPLVLGPLQTVGIQQ